jgi:hypothetical protein
LIFYRINPKFADFFEKTCVLKNLAGFSYKKPQVLLKKPAGLTCVEKTCVKPCLISAKKIFSVLSFFVTPRFAHH